MQKLLIFLFGTISIISCSNPTNSPQSNYLLNNYTFDSSGHPFYKGWIYSGVPIDDTIPQFVNVTPPGSSAKLSLALSPGRIGYSEFVLYNFPGLSSGIYELSLWCKLSNTYGHGEIMITKNKYSPLDSASALTGVPDTSWQKVSLFDTLVLKPADTINIILTGGMTEIAGWEVFYNNISFQKIQ